MMPAVRVLCIATLGLTLVEVCRSYAGISPSAQVSINCPGSAPPSGSMFTSEITINVGTRVLGAYNVSITYDSSVVTVASVAGGTTNEFSATPTTNDADFSSGTTHVAGFNGTSLTSPTGVVSVAKVTFDAIGATGAQ